MSPMSSRIAAAVVLGTTFGLISSMPAAGAGQFKEYASWELPLGGEAAAYDYAHDAKNCLVIYRGNAGDPYNGIFDFGVGDAKNKSVIGGRIAVQTTGAAPMLLGYLDGIVLLSAKTAIEGGEATTLLVYEIKKTKAPATEPTEPVDVNAIRLGTLDVPVSGTTRVAARLLYNQVELTVRSWDQATNKTVCSTTYYDLAFKKAKKALSVEGEDSWIEPMPETAVPKALTSKSLKYGEKWEDTTATIKLYK